jgi:hypothetical protein
MTGIGPCKVEKLGVFAVLFDKNVACLNSKSKWLRIPVSDPRFTAVMVPKIQIVIFFAILQCGALGQLLQGRTLN